MSRLMLFFMIGPSGLGLNSSLQKNGVKMAVLSGTSAGRGAGKTRAGSETFIWAIRDGGYKLPNLAGATAEDVRNIMIEGESGILSCAPANFYPEYILLRKN
jgi:phage terminase large subunit-like protein